MNNKNKKLALLGGDRRQLVAAEELIKRGWKIYLWGISNLEHIDNIVYCNSIAEAVKDSVAVLLPLPVSVDGANLNCPFGENKISMPLTDILQYLSEDTMIIGGKFPNDFFENLKQKGIIAIDYFAFEEFQIYNAYITAEAALSLAMNNLNKNISESKFAITGYGRIAKHLVRLLKSFDADVTVAARKGSDLAWAYSSGCSVIRIDKSSAHTGIEDLISGYDVIYNTVPKQLFDRDFLISVDKNTFIIDLSSAPGGVDVRASKELNSNVLWATSLPGKYAPVSAGRIIATCVDGILRNGVAI